MQKIKLFANYSIPVVWGIVGLVVGCVAVYYPLSTMWEHVIVKPENVTPTDGATVLILSLIGGVFIGAGPWYGWGRPWGWGGWGWGGWGYGRGGYGYGRGYYGGRGFAGGGCAGDERR